MPSVAIAALFIGSLAVPAPLPHHGIELAAFESCSIEAPSADDLALLLPSRAVATVRASSLRRALRNLARLSGAVPENDRALLEFALSEADADSGPWLEQLDLDRPCAAAVTFPPGGEPAIMLLLPARDPQALVAASERPLFGLVAHSAGGYVVLESSGSAVTPAGVEDSTFAGLARHDLAMHVDLRQIRESFGALIDMGFDQAESQIDASQESPEAADALLDGLSDARRMWTSAESLEVYLDERNGRMELGGDIALVGASWVAKRYGEQRYDLRSIARLVDPSAALTLLWSGPHVADDDHYASWIDVLQSELGERARPLAGIQARAFELASTQAGPLSAMNLALGVDGLQGALYLSSTDSGALVQQLAALFAAPEWAAMGLRFSGPHESTLQGATWREYVAAINVARIVETIAPEAEFGADEQLQAQRAVEALFGQRGLRVALTSVEGFAVAQLGGDDRSCELTAARLARPTPALRPQLLEALERTSAASASFVSQFDLGLLLEQASEFAAGLGEPIDLPLALVGMRLPITVHGAISPESARGGLSIDVYDLERFVNALKQGR